MLAAKCCSTLLSSTWNKLFIVAHFLLFTRPKITGCNRLLKTGLNNVVPPTLFNVVDSITIGIRGCLIRANPGWPGLVDHAQSSYIGETRVDIA